MTIIETNPYKLKNCDKINIIFGKNGCGKSTALKNIVANLRSKKNGLVNYITPERGGILTFEAGIEQNMTNPDWKHNTRQTNQYTSFRQQSVIVFKGLQASVSYELENVIKKRIDDKHESVTIAECKIHLFSNYIHKINALLENVQIHPDKGYFKILSKDKENVPSDKISSGESELITLAIECLSHNFECTPDQQNILFLDEPDVHLHPDLQAKLMHFLRELVDEGKFIVVIATHSTALIGALENYSNVSFEFMKRNQTEFNFKKILEEYKNILPIFGAHPLSNIYCSMPIFLLEGEDDVWIWQKAVRSSGGKLKVFPCSTGSKDEMPRYERMVSEIISSIYDGKIAMGYSLRDRDDTPEGNNLDDYGKHDKITRFMLSCRCVENLFLSDQVLSRLGKKWTEVIAAIDEWVQSNATHPACSVMKDFQSNSYNRKNFKNIKDILNILVGVVTNKPWQIVVGQEIGELVTNSVAPDVTVENSIGNYLGAELTLWLRK